MLRCHFACRRGQVYEPGHPCFPFSETKSPHVQRNARKTENGKRKTRTYKIRNKEMQGNANGRKMKVRCSRKRTTKTSNQRRSPDKEDTGNNNARSNHIVSVLCTRPLVVASALSSLSPSTAAIYSVPLQLALYL